MGEARADEQIGGPGAASFSIRVSLQGPGRFDDLGVVSEAGQGSSTSEAKKKPTASAGLRKLWEVVGSDSRRGEYFVVPMRDQQEDFPFEDLTILPRTR